MLDASAKRIPLSVISDIAVDIWRITRRALREESTPPSVVIACERAVETLEGAKVEIRDLAGEKYDENSRVSVIHEEGGKRNQVISECISPAIYYKGRLLRKAEVCLKGEADGQQTDS